MKSLKYLMKRNQVSFLLAFLFFSTVAVALAQAQSPGLFARLTMLKVPEAKQPEFETFARENIKPLQNMRRQKGEIVLWILFKVHFAGDADPYNYVGVEYSPAWEGTERKPFAALFKELHPNGDAGAFLATQRELRTIVNEQIFYQLDAVESNPPVPTRYVRLDYMKSKPGKTDDYLRIEREDWMPFHQTLVKDGQLSGWGLWQVVFPGGTGLPYDFVTSNRYSTYAQVLATDYENTLKKTNPSKKPDEIFNRTTQSRDIVRTELWEVMEILN
jgi:hypothetical protein